MSDARSTIAFLMKQGTGEPSLPGHARSRLAGRNDRRRFLRRSARHGVEKHGTGRASMRSTLANVAAMLGTTIEACPWQSLRFAHVAALRAVLAERFAPAATNKYLSAIRQVMRQAWLLGLMDGEDYQRAAAVRNVKGSRLPAGRALEGGEIRALFAACADGTPAGARDAAAFAMMFGMGMRRAEVAAARLADYEADSGTKPPASCTCPTSGTRLEAACMYATDRAGTTPPDSVRRPRAARAASAPGSPPPAGIAGWPCRYVTRDAFRSGRWVCAGSRMVRVARRRNAGYPAPIRPPEYRLARDSIRPARRRP